jgi:IS5 family transposase
MNRDRAVGQLCEVVQPHYPKGVGGRPPIGLERMLRIHFIQHWFNLADEACEEALYDSASLRRFVGIDLGREPVPDATTMLKFRRLLNDNKLGEQLFAKVGEVLAARRLQGQDRHHRGRHHHRCAQLDQERRQARATPRCTRPRRASSGTSA